MIPAAAARADVLVAAAQRACDWLATADPSALLGSLESLGTTGVDYDEWGTTLEETDASALWDSPEALRADLRARTYPALAIAPALLTLLDGGAAFSLVRGALPLDDTHFAPNYLEAWIQRGLEGVIDRLQADTPEDELLEMFLAGRLVLEKIPAELARRLPIEAVAEAVRGDALGYVHRDDALAFLEKHPAWGDPAALTALYEALGSSGSHAACAFDGVLTDRLIADRYAPATDVAARRLAVHQAFASGARSVMAHSARRLLFALGHRPTLEAEAEKLDALTKRRFAWDAHHTIAELRAPLAAAFALDPAHASARFAPRFAADAVASAHGAKLAHDILRAGLGVITDHHGTVLGSGLGTYLGADPGWVALLEPLRKHTRLGPLVRSILTDLAPKKPATVVRKKRA